MRQLLFLVAAAFQAFAGEPVSTAAPQGCLVKVEQAAVALEKGAQVLDLRPKSDWEKGHLARSKQLTTADENFTEKVKAMVDPAKPLLVYCRSGRCSAKAAKQLREAGFARVDELEGGIEAWTLAGRPVER